MDSVGESYNHKATNKPESVPLPLRFLTSNKSKTEMVQSQVTTQRYAELWARHLGESASGTPHNWESVRRLPGGLYDTVKSFVAKLNPDRTEVTIDLCCGTMALTRQLYFAGATSFIVADVNRTSVLMGLEDSHKWTNGDRQPSIDVRIIDCGQLFDFSTKSRLITCNSAAMLFTADELSVLLESALRHMSPGGTFLFSCLAWDVGCGKFRRMRRQLDLDGPEPDGGDPHPFAFRGFTFEGQNWWEFYRPRSWYEEAFRKAGFVISDYLPLRIPLSFASQRMDKFYPGARTYDLWSLTSRADKDTQDAGNVRTISA